MGSFWEIIILQMFILEALELWAFGDLWILRDGRNQREKKPGNNREWHLGFLRECYQRKHDISFQLLEPTHSIARGGDGESILMQATRGCNVHIRLKSIDKSK